MRPLPRSPSAPGSVWLRRARGGLRVAVSAVLLYVLLRRVDGPRLLMLIPHMRVAWLLPAVGLLLLGFWLSARRWHLVLADLGVRESLAALLYINWLTFFWSNFLPTTVGGDGFRFWRLQSRHPRRKLAALTGVLLDRLYGYLALLAVHTALLPWTRAVWRSQEVLAGFEAVVVAGLGGLAVLGLLGRRLLRWRLRGPAWLQAVTRRLQEAVAALTGRSRRTWLGGLGYSALFVVGNGVMRWCYLHMVGATAPLGVVVYASTVAALLGILPITLNGLGLTEAALVLALAPAGVPAEAVLLASFAQRLVNLGLALLGGLMYLLEGIGRT